MNNDLNHIINLFSIQILIIFLAFTRLELNTLHIYEMSKKKFLLSDYKFILIK